MIELLLGLLFSGQLALAAPNPPLLKGANINYSGALEDYSTVFRKANALRVQVMAHPGNFYEDTFTRAVRVDQLLATTNQTIILDLIHWAPNGYCGSKACSFSYNTLAAHWKVIAEKYKNNPRVIFDIMNEPALTTIDIDKFNKRLVTEIRKTGAKNIITISPAYGNPYNLQYMKYHGDDRTWMQVHIYDPFTFTGQGIGSNRTPVYYTSATQKRLNTVLGLIKSYATKNKKQIYLGEFAASVYTPTADRSKYYGVLIDACKTNRWHMTYHIWNESPVWEAKSVASLKKYLNE